MVADPFDSQTLAFYAAEASTYVESFGMGYFSKPTQWLTIVAQRERAA